MKLSVFRPDVTKREMGDEVDQSNNLGSFIFPASTKSRLKKPESLHPTLACNSCMQNVAEVFSVKHKVRHSNGDRRRPEVRPVKHLHVAVFNIN